MLHKVSEIFPKVDEVVAVMKRFQTLTHVLCLKFFFILQCSSTRAFLSGQVLDENSWVY